MRSSRLNAAVILAAVGLSLADVPNTELRRRVDSLPDPPQPPRDPPPPQKSRHPLTDSDREQLAAAVERRNRRALKRQQEPSA